MGAAEVESCFICRMIANDTRGEIVWRTDNMILFPALDRSTGEYIPDDFLAAPVGHYVDKRVPFDLNREVIELIDYLACQKIVVDNDYTNHTVRGGQTPEVEHIHIHLLQRRLGDPPLGIRGLLDEHRRMAAQIETLQRDLARRTQELHATEGVLSVVRSQQRGW